MNPLNLRAICVLVAFTLAGCASRVPRVPGPLGPVANAPPPPVHVRDLTPSDSMRPDAPASTPPTAPADPGVADPPPENPPSRRASGFGVAAADAAMHYLRHRPPGQFRNDCSGFVMAVFDRAGHPVSGNSRSFWADAKARGDVHHRKRPEPGDVAFFDNTYDRNGNGRRDDALTHVAVVVEVDEDGTILLAHGGTSKGRSELRMNLKHPHDRLGPDGQVYNDWLRARRRGEPENGAYLSAELFKGFATFTPDGS
jgi:hypothetical protein